MSTTKVTENLITELKAKHHAHELNHCSIELDGELFEIVARTPTSGDYNRFRDQRMSEDPGMKAGANRVLVASSLVWPEPAEWGAMLERKPGLADNFAGELVEAAGAARGARRKKL